MKKICTAALTIFLFLCSSLQASENPASAKGSETAIQQAREMILSYFNPAEGTISDIKGNMVSVKFPEGAQIRKGMRFSVFRQGKPFHHPVTNELIGYAEEIAGRLELSGEKGNDGLHSCVVIRGELKAGDTVRITESRIKLAFFQERKSDWELSEAFYGSLKGSGRFEIFEAYTPSYKPEDLSQLALKMNAEAVLLFSTPLKNEKRFLSVTLYWAEDAKPFAEKEESVGPAGTIMHAPEEEFIARSLSDTEPWGSYRLASGEFFAMGDVDGNGVAELVVSDGNTISIYNFREQLQETWTIKGTSAENHISIDVLDLNMNGRAEIFVTAFFSGAVTKTDDSILSRRKPGDTAVESFVLEFDPAEGYRKTRSSIPYFFRVSGKRLLMQKFDENRIFSGPVYEGEWENGDYAAKKQLSLPSDVNIYGFTFIDWQHKGESQIMTFDDAGYLILYDSKGQAVWKSSRSYGKFALSLESESFSMANPIKKWFLRGRLITAVTEKKEEVIVLNKIPVVAQVPGLGSKGSEVYSLWWDGSDIEEKLILSQVPGTITDYWVHGGELFLLAKGNLLSLVKNAVTGEFAKGSALYYYRMGEK
ncbi:MAG: VCBS repeat-containing protein [Nitrospiraceae bacterium]|nr:MAG: VCBS repeat-containing protein [Nitrospiraceae bacterium]